MARMHWTRWEGSRLERRPLRPAPAAPKRWLHVAVGALATSLWFWASLEIGLGLLGGVR
jgi:hypothetical protein